MLIAGCAIFGPAVWPGAQGQNVGLIGANTFIGQKLIYGIKSVNGKSAYALGIQDFSGILVPPGRYVVQYEWGHWYGLMNHTFTTTVHVDAGKCYQPWRLSDKARTMTETIGMRCFNRYIPNGDGTYTPKRVCKPVKRTYVVSTPRFTMKEYPGDNPLCEALP